LAKRYCLFVTQAMYIKLFLIPPLLFYEISLKIHNLLMLTFMTKLYLCGHDLDNQVDSLISIVFTISFIPLRRLLDMTNFV